jgi:hypothetical protein
VPGKTMRWEKKLVPEGRVELLQRINVYRVRNSFVLLSYFLFD